MSVLPGMCRSSIRERPGRQKRTPCRPCRQPVDVSHLQCRHFRRTARHEGNSETEFCPPDSQVGWVSPGVAQPGGVTFPVGLAKEPLYNLEAPGGDTHIVARFGFIAIFFPIFIDVRLDPQRGYALTATSSTRRSRSRSSGWTPTSGATRPTPSHDNERFSWAEALSCGAPCHGPKPSGLPPTPFMSNPTSCGPKEVSTQAISYERSRRLGLRHRPLGRNKRLPGGPVRTDDVGQTVDPQRRSRQRPRRRTANTAAGLANPKARATADLKTAVVTLPEGLYPRSLLGGRPRQLQRRTGRAGPRRASRWSTRRATARRSPSPSADRPRRRSPTTPPRRRSRPPSRVCRTSARGTSPSAAATAGPGPSTSAAPSRAKDVPTITGVNSEVQRLDITRPSAAPTRSPSKARKPPYSPPPRRRPKSPPRSKRCPASAAARSD